MKLSVVILAAGRSQRMGRCKALLPLGGRPAIEHLLSAAAACSAEPPLVISGCHDAELREALGTKVQVLYNPEWAMGRSSGLGLAQHLRPGQSLCVAPVDCPLVPPGVFQALAQHWRQLGMPREGWLAPCTRDAGAGTRSGHPVCIGSDLLADFAARGASETLRELRARAGARYALAVDAPEIHDNLDTPADWQRLVERLEGKPP